MIRYIITTLLILYQYSITNANIVVLNGLTHQLKTEKGQTYKGKIELQNVGKETKNIKIFLQDMTYSSDGTTNYTEPGSNKLSNSSWIKLETNLIELKAGEKADVYYELNVPAEVTLEGSYWTTCMIEPVDAIIPNEKNTGIQLRSIIRYAVQIISNFSSTTISPELAFKSINIENINDKKYLKIALENKGSIYCKTIISLELYNASNASPIEGEFTSAAMGLLPSTSKSFTIDITSLTKGKYKVVAFAKDDQENVFALEFELDV